MKRKTFFFLMVTILVISLVACGVPVAPATQPAPADVSTQAPPAEAVVPTQQSAPTQAFAPACQAGTSCAAPAVEQMDTEVKNTYCVNKIPYQNINVPPGTKFEVLDPSGDFKCNDTGQVLDGKAVIACTGKELISYQLKLSNPACGGSALATGTGQCQDGFGYDAAQNCCAPLTSGDAGSVTIKVNIGACPVPGKP